MIPSCIRLEPGQSYKLEEIEPGLFVVANAYDGLYEFFEGRPTGRVKNGKFVSHFLKNKNGEHIEVPVDKLVKFVTENRRDS